MGLFGIDWDPSHSSLATGAGLPWGPMQSGNPGDAPATPKERDINEFKAFDQSQMVKNLISNLRAGQAGQELAAQRRYAQLGAGKSDALRGALTGIGADTQNRAANIGLQAAKESWDDIQKQKQFAETGDLERYKAALQNWALQKQTYENEQAQRNAGLGGFLNSILGGGGK